MTPVSLPRSIKEAAEKKYPHEVKSEATGRWLGNSRYRRDRECFEAGAQLVLERLVRARERLEKIARGTHEEHPTCMGTTKETLGPPRTGGWEGWAREIRQTNIDLAMEALAEIDAFLKGDKA